jgi:hypothetical protein
MTASGCRSRRAVDSAGRQGFTDKVAGGAGAPPLYNHVGDA